MRSLRSSLRAAAPLVVTAGILIAVYRWAQPADPVFEGEPLSKHLKLAHSDGISMGGVGPRLDLQAPGLRDLHSHPALDRALRAVGTNALPLLVDMLGTKDPALKVRLWEWSWNWSRRHPRFPKLFRPNFEFAFGRNVRALAAFHQLGPAASPAIPRILPLLDDPDTALQALVALLSIGPRSEAEALAPTRLLAIPSPDQEHPKLLRSVAFFGLASIGLPASNAAPTIRPFLSSTNGRLRSSAAIAWVRIGAPADVVLPVLERALQTDAGGTPDLGIPPRPGTPAAITATKASIENQRNLLMDLYALAELGPRARTALPTVEGLRNHSDPVIRSAAAIAHEKIQGAPSP